MSLNFQNTLKCLKNCCKSSKSYEKMSEYFLKSVKLSKKCHKTFHISRILENVYNNVEKTIKTSKLKTKYKILAIKKIQ